MPIRQFPVRQLPAHSSSLTVPTRTKRASSALLLAKHEILGADSFEASFPEGHDDGVDNQAGFGGLCQDAHCSSSDDPDCNGFICAAETLMCLESCPSTDQCTGTAECIGGACVDTYGVVTADPKCEKYVCDLDANRCRTSCFGSADCTGSAICNEGACIDPECSGLEDPACGGYECQRGICHTEYVDTDCVSLSLCFEGQCVVADAPGVTLC